MESHRLRDPDWTSSQMARAVQKQQDSHPGYSAVQVQRAAIAGVYSIIIQDLENSCLMAALHQLQLCGWMPHSLQLDGILVEASLKADGSPPPAPPPRWP